MCLAMLRFEHVSYIAQEVESDAPTTTFLKGSGSQLFRDLILTIKMCQGPKGLVQSLLHRQ